MGARKNTRILRSPPLCVKKRQFSKTSLGRTAAHNLPAVLDFYFLCQIKLVLERGFGLSLEEEHFSSFVLAVFTLIYLPFDRDKTHSALSGFGDKIGVVDLEGVILNPKTVVSQLKKFADDDSIKAIVLHVNSPGGGVAASEEIYREVKRIRDGEKDGAKKN